MTGILLLLALNGAPADVPLERGTKPHEPVLALSNESNTKQLQDAQNEGRAVSEAVAWLKAHASVAGVAWADDLRLVWTLSPAEGYWALAKGGGLAWHDAPAGTVHLRVFALDAADGRLVPELSVRARTGGEAGPPVDLPYGRYPLMDAYGENVRLPENGALSLRLDVGPLPGRRHDSYNGYRFTQPVFAQFKTTPVDPATLAGTPLSDAETDRSQADQAAKAALQNTLGTMFKTANDGKDRPMGDWNVAYAVEYAEGWWCCDPPSQMSYTSQTESSAEANAHVEVCPRDARTGRFLPGLAVRATVLDAKGKAHGTKPVPFMWHPWLYHYGENWRVPHNGAYSIRVHIDPPAYRRYGRAAGDVLATPVDTTFDDVKIKTGQK